MLIANTDTKMRVKTQKK